MSIINEALKKTEQYIQENKAGNQLQGNACRPARQAMASDKPQGDGLASNSQSHSQSRKPPDKIIPVPKLLLIYILILLTGILLSKFIFGLLNHKVKIIQSPKQASIAIQQPSILPALPAVPLLPLEEKKPVEPDFVLNGIFFSDNDGYALVNNQIVREDDLVDGAEVTRITANTVELDNAGKLISLETRK